MAEVETEEVPVRNEVPQGEPISLSDKRWENFVIEVGDLLEVRFTSAEASVEAASVAFLVTKVGQLGLVEGRHIGSTNEALGKLCVNSINRKGLPIHICEEAPCPYTGAEVAGHVKSLTWWRPGDFKGEYITSWGKAVLKEYVDFGTIKRRSKEREEDDPEEEEPEKETTKKPPKVPRPKKGLKPPLKRPAAGATKRTRPAREEKDRGGLEKLRNRLAGLRQRLQRRPEQDEQEIIDVEAWSELQEEAGNTESAEERLALTLDTGGRLDPFTSKLALAPAVKQEAINDGTSREKIGKKRKVRVRKDREKRGPASQLLEVAEMEQKRRSDERRKKEKKHKSSGSKRVKELVELIGGKKKKKGRKTKGSSPDPSSSDSTSRDEADEESASSESEMLAPLQKKSLKKPGTVLRMLTRHARQTLDQSSVVDVGDAHQVTGGVKMATYFNLMIRPYHPTTSRDMKELHYLSICMDELRSGKLGALGDSLASRFLAVHSAVNEGGWKTAQHLELHPLEGAQSAPTPLLLQARRHSRLVARSQGKEEYEKGWKGSYNRDWRRDSWEEPKGKGKGGKGKGKGRGKGGRGKQDGWQRWHDGGGDKDNWWEKNKEEGGKDEAKESK